MTRIQRTRSRQPYIALITLIQAAAYSAGGVKWELLFNHYDRNNSGCLSLEEFRSASAATPSSPYYYLSLLRSAIRRGAKLTAHDFSDSAVVQLSLMDLMDPTTTT